MGVLGISIEARSPVPVTLHELIHLRVGIRGKVMGPRG